MKVENIRFNLLNITDTKGGRDSTFGIKEMFVPQRKGLFEVQRDVVISLTLTLCRKTSLPLRRSQMGNS